jgi:hypothetical protein
MAESAIIDIRIVRIEMLAAFLPLPSAFGCHLPRIQGRESAPAYDVLFLPPRIRGGPGRGVEKGQHTAPVQINTRKAVDKTVEHVSNQM